LSGDGLHFEKSRPFPKRVHRLCLDIQLSGDGGHFFGRLLQQQSLHNQLTVAVGTVARIAVAKFLFWIAIDVFGASGVLHL